MHTGINKIELKNIRNWFSDYVLSFKGSGTDLLENVNLKELHTQKVCEAIIEIGKSLGLNEEELQLAEIIALFHDVGRFEQYKTYGTFMDGKSVNHAELGIEILLKNKVLDNLSKEKQELILKALKYHNRALLPGDETQECLFFSKLLRDADKLDIYRVVTEYYTDRKNGGRQSNAIELNLPDTPDISENVHRSVLNKKSVNFDDVRSLNDFKLLQLAWIFDVNFSMSFRHIKSKKYLGIIHASMSKTVASKEAFSLISDYLDNQIKLPAIDFDICNRCRKCIKLCPSNAISLSLNLSCAKCLKYCLSMEVPCNPKEIVFSYEKCSACGTCIKECPEKAMFWFLPKK